MSNAVDTTAHQPDRSRGASAPMAAATKVGAA